MTHPGYHSLEKELTESLLQANSLYNGLRLFSRDKSIGQEEKDEKKQLFAFVVFREMNQKLGGFHFDRYRSLSSGDLQEKMMSELVESLDFDEFLANYDSFRCYMHEQDFAEFAASNQFRNLEDTISTSIKKNKVIPALGRAIGQDIVDALHLTENYGYLRISEDAREERFDFPDENIAEFVSLRKIAIVVENLSHHVLLKRCDRGSSQFQYLVTDFGGLMKGV
jgi:hypothetical protein